MSAESKAIGKADDSSKLFIQKALAGVDTHGFDLDSVYCIQGEYYVFEYLKCESDKVSPHTSNPKYYPYNWKKFYSLWQTAQRMGAYLFLVNYSDRPKDSDQVKVMYVKKFDYEELEKYLERSKNGGWGGQSSYLEMDQYMLTFREFSDYLKKINAMATLPVEKNTLLPKRVAAAIQPKNVTAVNHPVLPK